MLESIKSPSDIKKLGYKELEVLAGEIRNKIIETSQRNGGHIASNLGIVETTIALHRVFDTPRDVIIFDVGHQCYAHKMLTGRAEVFDTLRQSGGISGFANRAESPFDPFTEGHSGTSLSQALGMSAAFEKKGDDRYVVAVVGDGSFTNGMIYEALNSCKTLGRHLIIILNDNEMSISKNVGELSNHFTKIRTSKKYFTIKHKIKRRLAEIPTVGPALNSFFKKVRDLARRVLVSDNIFECMGIDYIGPVDGNNLEKMEIILEEARTKDVCTIVHIHTKKGKGYAPAENSPESFHSVSSGCGSGEKGDGGAMSFSSVFGTTMAVLTAEDSRVCAVTAAMGDGTGLSEYSKKFPKNFYDVGIAEEHALTFSAGLSAGGAKPVTVMYSTFSQRVYDQLQHDGAIQGLPLVLCLDRAGIVEGDGITHQGIYDVSEFSGIPGINIFSPETYGELSSLLTASLSEERLSVIRYPKGCEEEYDRSGFEKLPSCCIKRFPASGTKITVVTYGRITAQVFAACEVLNRTLSADVTLIKLVKVFPVDFDEIETAASSSEFLYLAEEGIKSGGICEKIVSGLAERGVYPKIKIHAVNGFVPHGSRRELFEKYGFTAEAFASDMEAFVKGGSVKEPSSEVLHVQSR